MDLDCVRMFVLLVLASGCAAASQTGPATGPEAVKVAAVQVCGYDKGYVERPGFDPTTAVVKYIEKAAEEGAQLVVFPEYLLGRIAVPGPVTRKIAQAAAAAKIYVVVGCWEVRDDNCFANTALLFDRQGHIQGKYLKTHAAVDTFEGTPAYAHPPTGRSIEWFIQNDPEWIMQKGDDLPVFDLDFARVGILTCYDGWFPEPFRVLSLKGAELIIWINGRRGHVEDYIVKAAMFHNSVALVTANQAYGGGTMIADWPATIKATCPAQEEAWISATIDLKRLRHIRKHSRNDQQRRPELYGEIVKEQPSVSHAEVVLPSRGLCAHRGAMATHPENTLAAFREAIRCGAHMIEFDVDLTRDKHLVVMHDATVDRTTNGSGRVSDLTLKEIKALDAGSWKAPEYAGERIPTMAETLAVMPVNIWLNVHLKGGEELGRRAAELIVRENRLHQAFLACGASAAREAKAVAPKVMICNMDRQTDSWDYVKDTIKAKAAFIQLRGRILPEFRDYAKTLKASGIRVNYFGTDDPAQLHCLFEYGVDFPLVNDIRSSMQAAVDEGIEPVGPGPAPAQTDH